MGALGEWEFSCSGGCSSDFGGAYVISSSSDSGLCSTGAVWEESENMRESLWILCLLGGAVGCLLRCGTVGLQVYVCVHVVFGTTNFQRGHPTTSVAVFLPVQIAIPAMHDTSNTRHTCCVLDEPPFFIIYLLL